jgi:murein L,D-transpeptidase YafK
MRYLKVFAILAIAVLLAGCGSKFRTYNGPEVTQIQVLKGERKLYLISEDRVLKSFDIGLGFAPVGPKQFEGDGKTPEGAYFISYKNPKSQYHLSLKISYPNEADVAFAEAQGKSPGGDIVIHGGPNRPTNKRDWTWGCIAVTDREIEVIYSMVKEGTPIYILP